MSTAIFRWALSSAALVAALAGCRRDEPRVVEQQAAQQEQRDSRPGALGQPGRRAVEVEGEVMSVQRATAEQLRQEIAGYRDWAAHTEAPVLGEHPHGDYVHLFYNETAKAAIGVEGDWPNDTIFVKENYSPRPAGEGPDRLTAITVMKKGAGVWFWAQYQPDGSLFESEEGTVVAGTADLTCIDCHATVQRRDFVFTPLGGEQ